MRSADPPPRCPLRLPRLSPGVLHRQAEHVDKPQPLQKRIPALCYAPGTTGRTNGFVQAGAISMLMTKERLPAIRTLRGWAISVLQDAGAIRECEDHGWMRDRADPHARERAFAIAREEPPPGVSSEAAAVAVAEVLDGIGDACPECEIADSDS